MKSLAAVTLLAVLTACNAPNPKADPDAPELQAYTADEARAEIQSLMDTMVVPEREQTILMGRLDSLLAEPHVANAKVTGVGVYRYGAGGFIIRGGRGKVLASFKGGAKGDVFSAGGVGLGFTVGGGAHQGLFLVTGLRKESGFGGNYKGGGQTATAGSVGVSSAVFTREDLDHELHVIATTTGLEATYGAGSVNIERVE